jgi:DsbC/DsbD-like thiol-disulfide interchange protein
MYFYSRLIFFLLFISFAMDLFAQNYKGTPISQVSVLAGTVQKGKNFTLGIRVRLEPAWHVYWKNPGDAGLPMTAGIESANGYEAGELKFPTPHKYNMGGDILYGYDSEVVFLLPIRAVANSPNPRFSVKLSWLACKEVCLPAEASIPFNGDSIDLSERKDNQRMLDRWTARLPQPGSGFNMEKAGVVVNPVDGKLSVFIKFLEMTPGTIVDFFPEVIDGFVTDYSKVKISEEGVGLILTPESKESKLQEIKGVAIIGTTGYEVKFPVHE